MAARSKSGGTNNPALPNKKGRSVIPNQYVFGFRSESDRAAFIAAAKAHGVDILDARGPGFSVLVKTKRPEDLLAALRESPEPASAESNYFVYSPEVPRGDAMKPQGEYMGFGNQSLSWLGVTGDNSTWGRGVTVAVLDNGVSSHPALREDRIARVDLINEGSYGTTVPAHAGHGNAVASIIAGHGDEVQGVAPDTTILSVKVMNNDGVGDSYTLAKGIVEAVDRGAKVLNMCLGTEGDSFVLRDAVDYALKNGAVLVAAVGNEGIEGVSYPARYDGVLAVSAVDANGRHMYFANRGDQVGISAPGAGVEAAWSGETYAGFSGTSAAVPFVSGAISYLMSENPGMTVNEAASLLVKYADDAGAPGKDPEFGNGILDLKRVMERNQRGIYDVAVGDVYVPPRSKDDTQIKVVVSAQNRGTEVAATIELKTDLGGGPQSKTFKNVAVGQTVSADYVVDVSKLLKEGGVPVSWSVGMTGGNDVNTLNNAHRAVIFLPDPVK